MNKILLISLSMLFANQMEVDGGLKVNGPIESQTIDSLLQVIQDLQGQISGFQAGNKLESRVFQTSNVGSGDIINIYQDLNEPIGPLDFYFIEIVDATGLFAGGGSYNLKFTGVDKPSQTCRSSFYAQGYPNGYVYFHNGGGATPNRGLFTTENLEVSIDSGLSGVLTVVITAQFPSDSVVQDKKSDFKNKFNEENK